MKLRKGDQVKVLSGANRGKVGKILSVDIKKNRAIVEGVNFIKRHTRPSQNNPQGGIIEREAAVHISNLAYVTGSESSRVGRKRLDDGKMVRYVKKTGETIND